jgi:hypothetical protein
MEKSTAEKMLFSAVLLSVFIHTHYTIDIYYYFSFPPTISTNIKRRHGRRDFSLFSFSPLEFDLVEKTRVAAAASSSRSFLFCLSPPRSPTIEKVKSLSSGKRRRRRRVP